MSFNTKLINLLKTDPRFLDDEGELVLAAVQDLAWKIDRNLVKLLLSDKEIKDKKAIESIIQRAIVCRVAFSENDVPYVVPVNFGYEDDCLYFHSAPEGKKIEMIKQNNNVCFELDIDHEVVKSESPCNWGMKYRSVIGFGRAFFVDDLEEKRRSLGIIVEHYSGNSSEYPEDMINTVVRYSNPLRVHLAVTARKAAAAILRKGMPSTCCHLRYTQSWAAMGT